MAGSFFGKVIIAFLAYFLVEVTGEQQYGGLGGNITLTPKVSGQPEDILWKHNGNKVVEFDGSQNVEYGRYKGRTILVWDSGALTIKGLTAADRGPYELEAVVKGKLQYSQHEVDVIDDVAQPSVTCVVDNTTPKNMDRTLLCSADLQPLTQFIWRSPGGSESPGPELFIPGGGDQKSVYTCVVKNPVSERTAEFTLNDCYTEEGSSSILAVVLSILLLLVLVAVLAFLLWCWRKGKKPTEAALRKSEEEAGLMEVTGNKDPEDDHSEKAGNVTSIPKVTDTEPVQDNPNPAQPKLVTPDPTPAQQDLVTPDPTPAQVTPAPTPAQVTPAPTPAQVTPAPTPAQVTPAPAQVTPAPAQVTPAPTPAQVGPGPSHAGPGPSHAGPGHAGHDPGPDPSHAGPTQGSEDRIIMWKNKGKGKEEVIKRLREDINKRRKENGDGKMDHNRCMGANTEDEGGNEGEMEVEGKEQKEPDTEKEGDDANQTSTQSDEMDETPSPDPNEQHTTQTTLQGQSSDSTGSIENQEELEHETSTPDPIEQHITQTTLQGSPVTHNNP